MKKALLLFTNIIFIMSNSAVAMQQVFDMPNTNIAFTNSTSQPVILKGYNQEQGQYNTHNVKPQEMITLALKNTGQVIFLEHNDTRFRITTNVVKNNNNYTVTANLKKLTSSKKALETEKKQLTENQFTNGITIQINLKNIASNSQLSKAEINIVPR